MTESPRATARGAVTSVVVCKEKREGDSEIHVAKKLRKPLLLSICAEVVRHGRSTHECAGIFRVRSGSTRVVCSTPV